jgi:DNA-binding SARP family transcriptional activator
MDFRILGPVEVATGAQPLRLGGPRQRALLAYLLLHANEVVAAERLLDELWFEAPSGGLAALQTQISRLRRVLVDRIATAASGYSIRVEPGELDLERFRSFLAEAGATEDPRVRSRLLRDADALWHGEPLAGLDVPFAAGEAAALEELRLAAVEDRIEADLGAGLDGELVSELSGLVRRHPLRERLRGELILALYRSGRQADALSEYRETRRVLDDELGLEPGPALRELEQAILRHDPLLTAVPAGAAPVERVASPGQPLPRRRPRRFVFALTLFVVLLAAGAFAVSADVDFPGASHAALKHPATVAAAPSPVSHLGTHPSRPHVRRVVHRKMVARPKSMRPVETVSAVAPPATVTDAPVVTTAPSQTTTSPKQAVAPAQTRPTKTTTTTTSSRSSWRTLSDDFSESTPKWTMWNADTEGAGATWTLESGQLDLTLLGSGVPGGRYDQLSEGFGSQCRFNGDFDARVDYQLIEWVPPTGARVQLSAWIFPDVNSDTARTSSTPGGEAYWGDLASSHNSRPTNDTEGALRITRTNALVKSYFLDRGAWVQLNAARVVGQVMLGLQLFAPAADWQQKETRIAFDNFSVSAPAMICP